MQNLRKYRGRAGLTLQQLADKTQTSRVWLNHLELSEDNVKITEERLNKLCEILNCTPIELYGLNNLFIKPQTDKDIVALIAELLNIAKDKESVMNEMLKIIRKELK